MSRARRDERALCPGRDRPAARIAAGDPFEQVVEGADRAAEQAPGALEQVALRPVDVRPIRHDQKRLVVQARQIALEQERDLARICGPDDEAQRHRAMVVLRSDGEQEAWSSVPLGA